MSLYQLYFLRDQARRAREQTERELYLPLISHETQSIKRFIAFPQVIAELERLKKRLDVEKKLNVGEAESKERYKIILEDVRKNIRKIGKKADMPKSKI